MPAPPKIPGPPKIVECKIVRKTTHYGMGGVIRPELYAFSEILMTDEHGVHYCSRTWEELPNTPFMVGYQIEQFRKRWLDNERRHERATDIRAEGLDHDTV